MGSNSIPSGCRLTTSDTSSAASPIPPIMGRRRSGDLNRPPPPPSTGPVGDSSPAASQDDVSCTYVDARAGQRGDGVTGCKRRLGGDASAFVVSDISLSINAHHPTAAVNPVPHVKVHAVCVSVMPCRISMSSYIGTVAANESRSHSYKGPTGCHSPGSPSLLVPLVQASGMHVDPGHTCLSTAVISRLSAAQQ